MTKPTEKHKKNTHSSILIAFTFCFVIPNILFLLAAYKFGIIRPLFNLDYLLTGILFSLRQRLLGSFALATFLIIDSLVIQGLVYPVIGLQDILYLLSMLPYAAISWQLAAAALLITLLAVILASYRYAHKAHRLSVLVIMLISISIYAARNHFDEASSDFYRSKHTLLGSQAAYFINTHAIKFLDSFFRDRNHVIPTGFRDAVAVLANKTEKQLNKKVLLVIVESWGVMKNDQIQSEILQPILKKTQLFDYLSVEKIKGNSATVDAELDHLCGAKMYYYNMKPVTDGFEICLPWKFKKLGYKTIAVHGATSGMYDRKDWYPRTGLDELYFRESRKWKSRCYSFPGICDSEIMNDFVMPIFAKDENIFMYWLTLNTHTRYDTRDIKTKAFDCKRFGLESDGELCRMNKLHAQFFSQLAESLEQPEMQGVEIILVGDHPPPIMDQREYQSHVMDGMVMQVHLKVRN